MGDYKSNVVAGPAMEVVYTWDNREWQSDRTTLTSSDVNDGK